MVLLFPVKPAYKHLRFVYRHIISLFVYIIKMNFYLLLYRDTDFSKMCTIQNVALYFLFSQFIPNILCFLSEFQILYTISFNNPIILGESINDKTFFLDISITLNDHTLINLEMQFRSGFWISLFFLSTRNSTPLINF